MNLVGHMYKSCEDQRANLRDLIMYQPSSNSSEIFNIQCSLLLIFMFEKGKPFKLFNVYNNATFGMSKSLWHHEKVHSDLNIFH